MALDETVKRLRALLEKSGPGPITVPFDEPFVLDEADAALLEAAHMALPALLDAADMLCRLERMVGSGELGDDTYGLVAALEAARREQARERGGSDGK